MDKDVQFKHMGKICVKLTIPFYAYENKKKTFVYRKLSV